VELTMTDSNTPDELEMMPAVPLATAVGVLLAAVAGAVGAAVVLPALWPGAAASLLGPEPKAYWYLSRSSGFVAFGLLWLSMIFGLIITNKMARVWPGGPTAFDLHQHVSLLALGFTLFHGLILLGDAFIRYSLAQLMIPFAGAAYRPVWVGVGQLGFYLMALVSLTFYVRKSIGHRAWWLIHELSFVMFVMGLVHGVAAGTDSGAWWASAFYWASGGSVLFLTVYRVLVRLAPSARRADRRAPSAAAVAVGEGRRLEPAPVKVRMKSAG
jgi:predicted ferric reductase